MDRAAAASRYAELPMPSTTDEHWRFTDLKGFDPEAFVSNGHAPVPGTETGLPETMLDVDTSGLAVVREGAISIERSPDPRITFEPFTDHERLGELVGADEKFAAVKPCPLGARPARRGAEGRRARTAPRHSDRQLDRGRRSLLPAARDRRA